MFGKYTAGDADETCIGMVMDKGGKFEIDIDHFIQIVFTLLKKTVVTTTVQFVWSLVQRNAVTFISYTAPIKWVTEDRLYHKQVVVIVMGKNLSMLMLPLIWLCMIISVPPHQPNYQPIREPMC